MKTINFLLNGVAIVFILIALAVVLYTLWFLSVLVGITIVDFIIILTVTSFVLWRLQHIFRPTE